MNDLESLEALVTAACPMDSGEIARTLAGIYTEPSEYHRAVASLAVAAPDMLAEIRALRTCAEQAEAELAEATELHRKRAYMLEDAERHAERLEAELAEVRAELDRSRQWECCVPDERDRLREALRDIVGAVDDPAFASLRVVGDIARTALEKGGGSDG